MLTGIILLIACLIGSEALAATRYVDGNLGADCTSGNYSIASRNCSGANGNAYNTVAEGIGQTTAGDTLLVRAGTYNAQIREVDFAGTGTSGSPIIVSRYQAETVTLQPSGSSGFVVRFQDDSIHHVTIDGFILDGSDIGGDAGGTVVYLGDTSFQTDSDHITLQNNEIRNGDGNGVQGGGTNHLLQNNLVHHNGQYAGYLNSNGMYLSGIRNTTVRGNTVYHNECYGIRVWQSAGSPTADDNIISGNISHHNGDGFGLDGASQCSSGGGGFVIADTDNLTYNNIAYSNPVGIEISDSGLRTLVYNSTFYGNTVGVYIPFAGATDTEIKNVIAYNNSADITDDGTDTVLSNNLTTDPSFVDAGNADFHLSEDDNGGTTLAAVTDDFDGETRGSPPDRGAFEFVASGGGENGGQHQSPAGNSPRRALLWWR